ncbi:MAG: zinc-binding alcohol dehydrogenase [Candidatus Harrisonbacteria bacterium]|nr:zinc-binding alcohol dehydrogenase [Candidatus Harrisonbacteria bacterium]
MKDLKNGQNFNDMGMKFFGSFVELKKPKKIFFHPVVIDSDKLKPSEIIAQTVITAISPGTEVAAYKGDSPLRPGKIYPRLLGYCNAAKILYVGKKVADFKPGDLILTDQSHRSVFKMPASEILARVPNSVAPEQAALAYLYNLGRVALTNGKIKKDFKVAVIGLGTLGLTAVAQAKLFNARIAALSASKSKLRLAKKLGAHSALLKTDKDIEQKVKKYFNGKGADIVVTTSNTWSDWKIALRLPRKNGIISVLGFPGRTEGAPKFNPLDPRYFYARKINIISADLGNNPGQREPEFKTLQKNCRKILNDISKKKLNPNYLISGIYPADQITRAYQKLLSRNGKAVTYLLDWRKLSYGKTKKH